MHDLQTEPGLVRERDIIGDRRRGVAGLFPVSRSKFRQMVRDGQAPSPIKCGAMSFWKRAEILAMIDRVAAEGRG
jgi:predicted DNA-binding transcriptional regulator AlpA